MSRTKNKPDCTISSSGVTMANYSRKDKVQIAIGTAITCVGTVIAFRSWTSLQYMGQDFTPFLEIGGTHVHHWQVALIFMPALLVLTCHFFQENKTLFKIAFILLTNDAVMFVDGILVFFFFIP